jgi:hypothetical protein
MMASQQSVLRNRLTMSAPDISLQGVLSSENHDDPRKTGKTQQNSAVR